LRTKWPAEMSDRKYPIIDACLEELLGGQTPPDLTARIMQEMANQGLKANDQIPSPTAPIPVPTGYEGTQYNAPGNEPVPPPVQHTVDAPPLTGSDQPTLKPAKKSPSRRNASSRWLAISITACVAIIVVSVVTIAIKVANRGPGPSDIAHDPNVQPRDDSNDNQVTPGVRQTPTGVIARKPNGPEEQNSPNTAPRGSGFSDPAITRAEVPTFENRYAVPEKLSDTQIVHQANAQLRSLWKENGVEPSANATDDQWARRLYTQLIGNAPSAEELNEFVDSNDASKRGKLIQKLLSEKRFASSWGRIWANTMIGQVDTESLPEGESKNGNANRRGLVTYLTSAIQENKPWDQIATELITAEGSTSISAKDYNPASSFLLASHDEDDTLATDRTARIFLGKQLRCAQCHDHPSLQTLAQESFWELNSFFRQMSVEGANGQDRLVDSDFIGENGGEVFLEKPNGLVKLISPRFLNGPSVSPSGLLSESYRRGTLAKLVVTSEDFSRATVNRVWAKLLGYGLTNPVDDLGAHNPPISPALMNHLAGQFRAHNYDMKALVRWITASEAFRLSTKGSPSAVVDVPSLGNPLFARFYSRPSTLNQVQDSLESVALVRRDNEPRTMANVGSRSKIAAAIKPIDNGNGVNGIQENSAIPRELANSELMIFATNLEDEGVMGYITSSKKLDFDEKVDHLFMAAVSRKPLASEKAAVQRLVGSNNNDRELALQDIWWVLLHSNEFNTSR
jgi:hypothetical protein